MITTLIAGMMITFPTITKPNLFDCHLKWIHENYTQKFVCIYQCRDSNTHFEWHEIQKNYKNCLIKKRYYRV